MFRTRAAIWVKSIAVEASRVPQTAPTTTEIYQIKPLLAGLWFFAVN